MVRGVSVNPSRMKAFADYVVFKTDTMFDSHTHYSGENGSKITFDPSFQPHLHVRTYGEVVEVPLRLGRIPLPMQIERGLPAYHDYTPYDFKYLSDIEPEVKVGDRIYFHFNTINLGNLIKEEGTHPNKTFYFRVRYDNILAAVREIPKAEVDEALWDKDSDQTHYKVIIPIGSWTLIQPDWESYDDILVPTYSHLKDKFGKPILKPKEQWIQKKQAPGYRHLTGFVIHVGSPLQGDNCEVVPGQKVWYRKNHDWLNRIEGEDYFTIRQRHIIGRLAPEEKIE